MPGRPVLEVGDLADGIGQRGDRLEARRHRVDRVGVEREPVDEGAVVAGARRGGDVFGIRGDQRRGVLANGRRHGQQRGVLGAACRPRDLARGGARRLADASHVGADVGERAETRERRDWSSRDCSAIVGSAARGASDVPADGQPSRGA